MNTRTTQTKQILYRSHPGSRRKQIKAGKQTEIEVQYPDGATEKTREAVEAPAKVTDKRIPDEPYKDIPAFTEKGKVSIFKNKNYQFSVFIGIKSSQICLIPCLL